MKDKEMIEEMTKDKLIKVILQSGGLTINMFGRGERIVRADVDKLANNLIESGLIIPQDSVVLSKEKYELLVECSSYEGVMKALKNEYIKGSKETAEKILERGKYCMPSGLREWIIEQFGVEIKE